MELTCLIDGNPTPLEQVVAASTGFGKVVEGLPSWQYTLAVPKGAFLDGLSASFRTFVEMELEDDEDADDADLLALRKLGSADLSEALARETELTFRLIQRFLAQDAVDAFTSADPASLHQKAFVLQTLGQIEVGDEAVNLTGLAYPARAG